MKKLRTLSLLAIGAAGAHLLDPDRGRARRAELRDRVRSRLDHAEHDAVREARYEAGVQRGEAARAEGKGEFHAKGDGALRDHVHQVLAESPIDAKDVNVEVVDGFVTLRGQVQDVIEIRDVKALVAEVPGVTGVDGFLHVPGTPAPNKADALDATS